MQGHLLFSRVLVQPKETVKKRPSVFNRLLITGRSGRIRRGGLIGAVYIAGGSPAGLDALERFVAVRSLVLTTTEEAILPPRG